VTGLNSNFGHATLMLFVAIRRYVVTHATVKLKVHNGIACSARNMTNFVCNYHP